MAESSENVTHVSVTEDGLKTWSPEYATAWTGLLRVHNQLIRALDADLIARHRLNLGAYEALMRLATAEAPPRMSELAEGGLLSQSRTSRIVDQLESRGLVARTSCPGDSRVVHVVITDAGRDLLREVQDTVFDGVEERFFARLDCDDVGALHKAWTKVLGAEAVNAPVCGT